MSDTLVTFCCLPVIGAVASGVVLLIVEYKSGFFSEHARTGELGQASLQLTNITQSVSQQIVTLSRTIIPPIVDFKDGFFLWLMRLNFWVLGTGRVNVGKTDVQVRNVRQPVVHRYERGYHVVIEFALKNIGSAGLVAYWVEFPFDVRLANELGVTRTFVSERRSVEVPALSIKRIRDEYPFPLDNIPLAHTPYKVKVRAVIHR